MSTSIDVLRGEHMKNGDTLPSLRVQLFESGNPFNLSSYTVEMRMKLAEDSELTVDNEITKDKEDRGIVTYDWSSGDTDNSGTYEIEFVASDGSGDVITFPNNGYGNLFVEEGLN